MESTQLYLIETARTKPVDFSKMKAPFRDREGYDRKAHCRAPQFFYWDSELERLLIVPIACNVSFWKDDKTPAGELKMSINGKPERERLYQQQKRDALNAELAAQGFFDTPAETPKKKRKPYKWSTAAIVRNRQRKLRKRIEKKYGYDPDRPQLFQDELAATIELEFQERIAKEPDYFIQGKRYNENTGEKPTERKKNV